MSPKHAKNSRGVFSLLYRTGMKFRYRLLILATVASLSLTFYLLKDHVLLDRRSSRQVRLVESFLWPYRGENKSSEDGGSCTAVRKLEPSADIFTINLKEESQYDIESDGEYVLPSPEIDSLKQNRKPLQVILMPHSHNDPGWLKKLKTYYADQTRHILNNMVQKLHAYPNMTFVWAETVFLDMWWKELEDDMKPRVRRLISNGQLEIVSGGWVMPDEASTHYVTVIDQLVEGHQWLWRNLRVKPENSWSIDPFGHSATMPYLWKLAGMDNMVVQRIHQAIKTTLATRRSLEYNWRQFWDTKGRDDILCHVNPYMLYGIRHTCGPNRFTCTQFDFRYIPEDIDRLLATFITPENIAFQAKLLYEQYIRKAFLYKYDVLLIPLGDDFRYDKALEWDQQYKNYEALITYMNNHKEWNVHVKFGTLKEFFRLLRKSENKMSADNQKNKFPSLSGDFFPYSDKDSDYWSGYFSTRPFYKRLYREVESRIRAADILNTLASAYAKHWNKDYVFNHYALQMLQEARRNLALFLHHDAITGTSKTYVMEDYEMKLYQAMNNTEIVLRSAAQVLLTKGVEQREVFLNISHSDKFLYIDNDPMTVHLFNPRPHHRQYMLHVRTNTDSILVKNSRGDVIPCQISPVWEQEKAISGEVFELIFPTELLPLGFVSYDIVEVSKLETKSTYLASVAMHNTKEIIAPPTTKFNILRPKSLQSKKEPIVLENDNIRATFDALKGTLTEVIDKASGNKTMTQIEFLAYKSRGSGAYIFFPTGEAKPMIINIPVVRVIEGPIVSEIHMIHINIHHKIRIYHHLQSHSNVLHIENMVDMHDMMDREIIMRFQTDVANKDLSFFTDSNGFQLIQRRTMSHMSSQGNYYPMTTMAHIEDDRKRFTILSEQPHGVSALSVGALEFMLDRQLMYDDGRGLGEGILDNRPVISKFVILFEDKNSNFEENSKFSYPSLQAMMLSDSILQHPIVFFPTEREKPFLKTFQLISKPFPCDLTIVSLRNLITSNIVYNGTSFIVHRRGYTCGFLRSGLQCDTVQRAISMVDIFNELKIRDLRETTLSHLYDKATLSSTSRIYLDSMEIKSYLLHLNI